MRKLTLPLLVIAGSLKRLCVFLDKRGFSSQLLQHLFHPSSDGQTKFQSIQIALVWSWSQEGESELVRRTCDENGTFVEFSLKHT